MRLFENVQLTQEPSPFVVPAGLAAELAHRMRDEGIDFSYHAWDEVVRGEAPVLYNEAMDLLRPFEEMGYRSVAPCVIESHVSSKNMLQRSRWLLQPPNNPCLDLRDNAYGFVLPKFWEGAAVASFDQWPQRRTLPCDPYACFDPSQYEVLTAQDMVRKLAEGKRLDDGWWYSGKPIENFGLTTKDLLERMIEIRSGEPLKQCATFPTEDLRDAFVREALATYALSIVRWTLVDCTSKLLSLPVSMVLFEGQCCDEDLPRGIVCTAQGGFLREVATESATVGLRRIRQSAFGFMVESVRPDLAASTAQETGTDLRKVHGPFCDCFDFVLAAHREYACDPSAHYPVTLLKKWVTEQDEEHVMLIEAPTKVPGTVVRVYIGWDTPWAVITSDQAPRTVPYCHTMQGSGAEGSFFEYLPASDGPNRGCFSSTFDLDTEESFRALEREYPQVAELAKRLYRRTLELRYEGAVSHDANKADQPDYRRLQRMLDNEVWPCVSHVGEEEEPPSIADFGQGIVARIARGEDVYGRGDGDPDGFWDYAKEWTEEDVSRHLDNPAEWMVEELDLPIETTRWLVHQVGASTVRDLVALLADGLKDAPGYDFWYRVDIEKALSEVGLL